MPKIYDYFSPSKDGEMYSYIQDLENQEFEQEFKKIFIFNIKEEIFDESDFLRIYFRVIDGHEQKTEVKEEEKNKNIKIHIFNIIKDKVKGKPKKGESKIKVSITNRNSKKENTRKQKNISFLFNDNIFPSINLGNNEFDQFNEPNPITKNSQKYQDSCIPDKNKIEDIDKNKIGETKNNSLSKTSAFSSSEKNIKNKSTFKFITKKRGRDKKDSQEKEINLNEKRHNKEDFDNVIKKIKSLIIKCLIIYSNNLLNEVKYDDYGKKIKFEELKQINASLAENTNVKFNKDLLNKKIKVILSEKITEKIEYKNGEYHNKKIIDKYYYENKVQKIMNFFELEFRVIFNYLEKGEFYESNKNKDNFILLSKFEDIYHIELERRSNEDIKIILENIKNYVKNIEKRKPRINKKKSFKKKKLFEIK